MDDPAQAAVYEEKYLESAYYLFVWCFQKFFPDLEKGITVLELGCGTAGISLRLAKCLEVGRIDGVDGAESMLQYGREAVEKEKLSHLVQLFCGVLPEHLELPCRRYGVIVSNSFLHHLDDPLVLWDAVKRYGDANAAILVVDLIRPSCEADAQDIIKKYLPDAPPLLRRDMLASLLAAFTVEEVTAQLHRAGLSEQLCLKRVSPFQYAVYGRLR